MYRASLCPGGCGHPVADTTTHEDDGPEFVATKTVCRACAALLEAQRAVADGRQPSPDAPARLWLVTKVKR